MKPKLLICLAFTVSCYADPTLVRELVQASLADTRTVVPPNDPLQLRLGTAMRTLTSGDFESLLPLAFQCLTSQHQAGQEAGTTLLIGAALLPTSAALLDPYLRDFDKILSDPASPMRQAIIAILEITNPSMSPGAMALFMRHIEDRANTPLQTGAILAAVLRAGPENETIAHRVFAYAETRSEQDVKQPILQQIGLSKIESPEALRFVGIQLDNREPAVRTEAIVAVSRLSREARAHFASKLSDIAQDPDVKPEIRKAAEVAINGR
jgi:phosphoglycolate phosphatase-like HAD superfamily hydrolase